MRSATIDELHARTSELVREVLEGDAIVIEQEGRPVAELRAIPEAVGPSPEVKARIFAEMQELWDRLPFTTDSTRFIEEDRNR